MDDEYENVSYLSVPLSRALDEVGLNESTVKKRRETFLYVEELSNIFISLMTQNATCYHFGSQSEGTTTQGLGSDVDVVCCLEDYAVIQDISAWTPGKTNLLMLHENTSPGYCRLQLLKEDKPEAETTPPREGFLHDKFGRVIMRNTIFSYDKFTEVQMNGPAHTYVRPFFTEEDNVPALRCTSSKEVIGTWARRKRRGDWPSRDLMQQVIEQTPIVVPVGHKLSETPELEFRISTSLAERCLMFSLNTVQIKCYVLLKILVKAFVTPVVGQCISSFHCKTAVLFYMENTTTGFWREDNLIHCVMWCLLVLYTWATYRFCPHYITAGANLFDGKVTSQNRDRLLSQLKWLLRNIRDALQNVTVDGLGQVLSRMIDVNSKLSIEVSGATLMICGTMDFTRHRYLTAGRTRLVLNVLKQAQDVHTLHVNLKKRLDELISYRRIATTLERKVVTQYIEIISCYLGSRLASSALSRNERIPQEAMDLLETGATNNMSAKLTLASVHICRGELGKAELLLLAIEQSISENHTQTVCMCKDESNYGVSKEFCCQLWMLGIDETEHKGLFAHCVMFSEPELFCTPIALRYEFFRSVRSDVQRQIIDDWMVLAVVDALPYMYFLKYITYRQLRQKGRQAEAIRDPKVSINEGDESLDHAETAWNLLGQCYEMEQQFDSALDCYLRSLEIKPRNNVANWLVPSLINRCIQQPPGVEIIYSRKPR